MQRSSTVPVLLGVVGVALAGLMLWALLQPKGDVRRESINARIEAGEAIEAPDADRVLSPLSGTVKRSLRSLRGQVVVMNFWAQWCLPCQDEAPLLERTHRALQRTNQGTVLGVVFQSSPSKAREFQRDNGMTYPSMLDPGSRFARGSYGVSAMPETFIIDRQGRIRAVARAQITPEFLARNLKRAGVTGPALRAPLAAAR